MGFPTDPFTAFISNAPLAATPGSSDMIPLIQGGITTRLPISALPGLTPIIVAPVTEINANTYNALITDYTINVNRSPAAPTLINLPNAPGTGHLINIKDIAGNVDGTNSITIGNATIDGVAGLVIPFAYGAISLESTGHTNNWSITAKLIG